MFKLTSLEGKNKISSLFLKNHDWIRREGKIYKGLSFLKQCLVDLTWASFSVPVRPVVGATRDHSRVKGA